MIVFNKKWNEDVLSKALLDIVQPSTNPNVHCGECSSWNATLVDGICTQSIQQFESYDVRFGSTPSGNDSVKTEVSIASAYNSQKNIRLDNFSIVTEKFLKTLDKFYSKLYNEDFTTNIFYSQHILSIFQGITKPDFWIVNNSNKFYYYHRSFNDFQMNKLKPLRGHTYEPIMNNRNPNDFKLVIDRMIALGLMGEEDRLDFKDQCSLTDLKRANIQIINNIEEKTIDIVCNNISDIIPDIKTEDLSSREGVDQTGIGMSVEHSFHKDKRLFLMYTPYLRNEATVKYGNTVTNFTPEEPTTMQIHFRFGFQYMGQYTGPTGFASVTESPSHEPVSYFKPKKYQTRFNKGSMPMATHLIWRIGTQETRETAITENSPFVPEVIFDHVDRISHIDNFKLRIKYNVVRF